MIQSRVGVTHIHCKSLDIKERAQSTFLPLDSSRESIQLASITMAFTSSSYEQDSRCIATDNYINTNLIPPSHPYYDTLEHALSNSQAKGLDDISVSRAQGKYLSVQAQIVGAKNILEVGTLGAFSSIWLASSGSDVKVTSIEIDPETAEVARENIYHARLEDRIQVLVGAAVDVLPGIVSEVKEGKRPRFDFSFIDADKENNLRYFSWAKEASRKGAIVYIDNIVRKGKLAESGLVETDPGVRGARTAVEGIGKDPNVEAAVLQTVGEKSYDGFLLALIK